MANVINKIPFFGKILIFIDLLLIIVVFFRSFKPVKEGLDNYNVNTTNENFLFKQHKEERKLCQLKQSKIWIV